MVTGGPGSGPSWWRGPGPHPDGHPLLPRRRRKAMQPLPPDPDATLATLTLTPGQPPWPAAARPADLPPPRTVTIAGRHAKPPAGDTLRWRGLLAEDHTGRGLTVPELTAFLEQVTAEADAAGVDPAALVPLAATWPSTTRPGRIRHAWVAIRRR